MFLCVNEQFGEGVYETIDDFKEMCVSTWGEESVENLTYSGPADLNVEENGNYIPVLRGLFFVIDGYGCQEEFYSIDEAKEYIKQQYDCDVVFSGSFDSSGEIKTKYGKFMFHSSIVAGETEEQLEAPETITYWIVW